MNEELWEMVNATYITKDYRLVASVDRGDGEMYDLGQNSAGDFLMFRRSTDPWALNSHLKGERLSPGDFAGFGLESKGYTEDEVCRASEEGEFSSLCRSNFIHVS